MSTLKSDTLSNVAGTYSIGTERVARATAAAWVNFNGSGTVAIRAAYNVSSITDSGTGNYGVNFTTAFANTNYAAVCSASNTDKPCIAGPIETNPPSTTSFRVETANDGGTANDSIYVYCAFFR